MRRVNYQITLISAPAPLHATVQLGVALHYDWWLNRPPILCTFYTLRLLFSMQLRPKYTSRSDGSFYSGVFRA